MNEGSMKKGLHNDMPSKPRPLAPHGQSIGTMMIAVEDWEKQKRWADLGRLAGPIIQLISEYRSICNKKYSNTGDVDAFRLVGKNLDEQLQAWKRLYPRELESAK